MFGFLLLGATVDETLSSYTDKLSMMNHLLLLFCSSVTKIVFCHFITSCAFRNQLVEKQNVSTVQQISTKFPPQILIYQNTRC